MIDSLIYGWTDTTTAGHDTLTGTEERQTETRNKKHQDRLTDRTGKRH